MLTAAQIADRYPVARETDGVVSLIVADCSEAMAVRSSTRCHPQLCVDGYRFRFSPRHGVAKAIAARSAP